MTRKLSLCVCMLLGVGPSSFLQVVLEANDGVGITELVAVNRAVQAALDPYEEELEILSRHELEVRCECFCGCGVQLPPYATPTYWRWLSISFFSPPEQVSTRGASNVLTTEKEFKAFKGYEVIVETTAPDGIDQRDPIQGRLVSVER